MGDCALHKIGVLGHANVVLADDTNHIAHMVNLSRLIAGLKLAISLSVIPYILI